MSDLPPAVVDEFRHKSEALTDFAKLLRDANMIEFPPTGDAERDRTGAAMAEAMRLQTENAANFADRIAATYLAASAGLLS